MSGDINVPKVGKVDKRVVAGVGAAAVAFVAWSWYRGKSAPADATDGTEALSDFTDGGGVPGVLGAVSPTNSYGLPDNTPDSPAPSQDSYGFTGTTNAQWTQYVTARLVDSDTWSYTTIVAALGKYLAGKPLTTLDQTIVQAAIAVGGPPPVGSPSVIPGGDTKLTVAPVISSVATTATTAVVSFSAVPGASSYRVYRSGVAGNVGSSNGGSVTVGGLRPNTSYTFSVRGLSASGVAGPTSKGMAGRTKAVNLATPGRPRVSAVTKTSAHVTTSAVAGADGYNWYVNGALRGRTDAPAWTATGLKSRTRYSVSVAADNSTQAPGKRSVATPFKTK